jgi:tRNA (adenine22-N1)-methyltransferase
MRAVAELVPEGARVGEVGTDAGALALALLDGGRASRCIATDRSACGLGRARRRGARHIASGRLELRLGSGLAPLAACDRLDVVVLAGMGARSMVRILDDPRLAELSPRRLVLQPQTEPALLRGWLGEHGFAVVGESRAAERGRDYVVIAAERAPLDLAILARR